MILSDRFSDNKFISEFLYSLSSSLDSPRKIDSSRAAASLEVGASHGAISSAHSRTVTPEGSPNSSQRSSQSVSSRSVSPDPETSSQAGASHESELNTRRFPSNTPHQALETPAQIGVLKHPQTRERFGSPPRN